MVDRLLVDVGRIEGHHHRVNMLVPGLSLLDVDGAVHRVGGSGGLRLHPVQPVCDQGAEQDPLFLGDTVACAVEHRECRPR